MDVDLAAGTVTLSGSNMSLTSIEQAAGTICCNDTLDDAGPNELFGFAGNDILTGAEGDDLLNGEGGTDSGDGEDGEADRCISIENPSNCELFEPAAAAQTTRALNSPEPTVRRPLAHAMDGEVVRMPLVGL
ncbi:MAG TPA: hypothetical protein VF058_10700 [Actinomycetota bacterium]